MIPSFQSHQVVPLAQLWYKSFVVAFRQAREISEAKRSPDKFRPSKGADDLPKCVKCAGKVGLRKAHTRNDALLHLSLLFRDLGWTREETERWLVDWCGIIPNGLSSTPQRQRERMAIANVRWAFSRTDTNANCAKIRDTGLDCPGDSACEFKASISSKQETIPKVTLEEAVEPRYRGKVVEFEGVVVAKDSSPQLLPKVVQLKCIPRSDEPCASCKYRVGHGELVLSDAQTIRLATYADEERHPKALQTWMQVPKDCPGYRLKATESQALLLAVIQPGVGNRNEQNRENVVYFQGSSIQDQTTYRFRARTLPHPKTFKAVHLASYAEPLGGHLKGLVEGDDLEQLRAFSPGDETYDALKDRVGEISYDFEAHLHKIYGRQVQALMMALPFFSPLYITLPDDDVIQAALRVLAYGDTGQGKTELARRYSEFFGVGRIVSGETMSLAGLIGGVDTVNDRRFPRKGVLPQEDGGIAIIDEWGGVADEIATAISEVLSSYRVSISKIAHAVFLARTRLLILANPTHPGRGRISCTMADAAFGIQHALPLMRTPEDLRRMTYVVGFKNFSATHRAIHEPHQNGTAPRFTPGLCNLLIRWIYQLDQEHVVIEPGAWKVCVDASEYLSGDEGYSQSIPLFAPGDTRHKIARVAAALAALTFSTPDLKTLVIQPRHVDLACNLLKSLYSTPDLQFDLFTSSDPMHKKLVFLDFVKMASRICAVGTNLSPDSVEPRWQAAFRVMMTARAVTKDDVTTMSGLNDSKFFSTLSSYGLMDKAWQGFRLNAKGIKVAKLMLKWGEKGINFEEMTEQWFETYKEAV